MREIFRQQKPLVSVIIPTHNSAKTLTACLKSIVAQSYPFIELVVVDGYSDDETVNLANLFGAKVISCRGTQAAARNAGITFSKGDYILFLDSDQQLSRRVIEECIYISLEHGVEAIKIPEKFIGTNFIGKCSALWKNRMVE
ncbi:MAG: glycosyltransferase family 2 protein, partial [Candidatus Bathyarchaeia archaeon]